MEWVACALDELRCCRYCDSGLGWFVDDYHEAIQLNVCILLCSKIGIYA